MVSKERHKFNSDSKTSRGGLACFDALSTARRDVLQLERIHAARKIGLSTLRSEFHLVNKNDETEDGPRLTPLLRLFLVGKFNFSFHRWFIRREADPSLAEKSKDGRRDDISYQYPIRKAKKIRVGRRFDDEEKYSGGINMGCRLSFHIWCTKMHSRAKHSSDNARGTRDLRVSARCHRSFLSSMTRYRLVSLSLFVSRVSLLSQNERHGRKLIGRETRGLNALEKSSTIFFFFFFSLLVRKKGRKNGGNYGQARDVSWKGEKIWWT